MRRRWSGAFITALALLHPVVVIMPAAVLAAAADKGAVPDAHGGALLLASGLVGTAHGVVTWYRLRRQWRQAPRSRDAVIAAFDGLVVLALTSTLLLFVALGAYAPLGFVMVNRGWSVLIPWTAAQGLAVLLAEFTRWAVMVWLAAEAGRQG